MFGRFFELADVFGRLFELAVVMVGHELTGMVSRIVSESWHEFLGSCPHASCTDHQVNRR